MLLYVHKKTVRYLDYGDLLETVTGLAWSTTGKAEDAFGFERGEFGKLFAAKRAVAEAHGCEILEGEPVARSHDMNPHGFI
jgi:hypothetical protein